MLHIPLPRCCGCRVQCRLAVDRAVVSIFVIKIPDIDSRQATFENIPFVRRYRWHPLRVARQPPTCLLPHWRLRGTSELKVPACSIGCDARDPTWRSLTGSTDDRKSVV